MIIRLTTGGLSDSILHALLLWDVTPVGQGKGTSK